MIGRADRIMEPSPAGENIFYVPFDPNVRATFFVGGVEARHTPHLLMTPRTVITYYDRTDGGIRPETDFQLRLTLSSTSSEERQVGL